MRALLDLLVPSLCDGCGVRAPPPWCERCDDEARRLRPADPCVRCAGPAGPGHPCWAPSAPIAATVALSRWTGPVARTVLHAKLAGRREVLVALGERLAALVGVGPAVVVPVPTVPRRARLRGLDHTAVLATAVAETLDLPVVAALRTASRSPDRGASPAGTRRALPDGAFAPTPRARALTGEHVLLVDDVVTTGATLAASARALADAGPATTSAVVVARAGAHGLGT